MPAHHQASLPEAAAAVVREEAAAADAAGALTPALQELAHREGWFRMLVPARYGGEELPLPELLLREEAIAAADGSLGWTVTLCSGAGWFGGFLDEGLARRIFAHPALCIAGSGAATGTADLTADGFRLNGHWAQATGAPIASHFTTNCVLRREGRVLEEAGRPAVRAFIVPADDVTVHSSWHSMGLRASASHAFSMQDVAAAPEQAFRLAPEAARVDAALYRYPFLPLAEATLAITLCGMAAHFEEASRARLERTHRDGRPLAGQEGLVRLRQGALPALASLRGRLLDRADESWRRVERGDRLEEDLAGGIGRASRQLAALSGDVVNGLYRYCGLAAADSRSELNRIFRDFHTAGQHSLLL